MQNGDLHHFLTARARHLALPLRAQVAHAKHFLYSQFDEFDTIYGVARGLAYLHRKGIVHGDIKPDNVFLDPLLNPLIADFGLTKDTTDSTSPGQKGFGTYMYQAPELMRNGTKTKASDMFAVGMTIAEVLTAKVPMSHLEGDFARIHAISQNERPTHEPLSFRGKDFKVIWEIASCCWDQDPEVRPSAREVVWRMMRVW